MRSHHKAVLFSQKMTIWVNKVNRISVSVWGCAVWKNFPAMAYARTSAGPAGRAGACKSQIPCRTSIPRHVLFENRSLVDFTERKRRPCEWSWWKWQFLLTENAFCVWTAMALEAISFLKINHWYIFKKEISENENSTMPRCDFIYTKNSARPGSGFYLHKI